MRTFSIEIKEELARVVSIDAEDENEALAKVYQLYRGEEIVLDWDDFVNVDFCVMAQRHGSVMKCAANE